MQAKFREERHASYGINAPRSGRRRLLSAVTPDVLLTLTVLFLFVGAVYASVGHAGASGYLAVMALVGVETVAMRPTALAINVLVAIIAFSQFARAGHFRWQLFWPFAVTSAPAAFIGGLIDLPPRPLGAAIGLVLLLSAGRMFWSAWRPRLSGDEPHSPPHAAALTAGAALGLAAGLTGTGGGIFLSPLLLLFNWADTKQTAAAASLFILLNSVAGLTGLAASGWRPDWELGVLAPAACLGGVAGAWFGSRRATPRALRLLLGAVLALAATKLLLLAVRAG